MAYAGTSAIGCGWRLLDGVSRVSVDCLNDVPGVGCRSVIAIGGPMVDRRRSVSVNGHTFYRIAEADVALNDGYCDLFNDPVTLRYAPARRGRPDSSQTTDRRGVDDVLALSRGQRAARRGTRRDDMDGVLRAIYPGVEDPGEPTQPPVPVIPSAALGEAVIGQPYAYRIAFEGGVAPFAWRLSLGALPAGLAHQRLDGEDRRPAHRRQVKCLRAAGATRAAREAEVDLVLAVRAPTPVVESAAYLKAKRLEIRGLNFAPTAVVTINGVQVAPGRPTAYDEPARTLTIRGGRKKLNIQKGAGDANVLVVTVDGSPVARIPLHVLHERSRGQPGLARDRRLFPAARGARRESDWG